MHSCNFLWSSTLTLSLDFTSFPYPRGRLILYSTCLPECIPGIGIQKGSSSSILSFLDYVSTGNPLMRGTPLKRGTVPLMRGTGGTFHFASRFTWERTKTAKNDNDKECPLSKHQFIEISICALPLENKINSNISMSSDPWKSVRQRSQHNCTCPYEIVLARPPSLPQKKSPHSKRWCSITPIGRALLTIISD